MYRKIQREITGFKKAALLSASTLLLFLGVFFLIQHSSYGHAASAPNTPVYTRPKIGGGQPRSAYGETSCRQEFGSKVTEFSYGKRVRVEVVVKDLDGNFIKDGANDFWKGNWVDPVDNASSTFWNESTVWVNGLSTGQSYNFYMRAEDEDGNFSLFGTTDMATIGTCIQDDPVFPDAENLQASTTSSFVKSRNYVYFKVTSDWTYVSGFVVDRSVSGVNAWNTSDYFASSTSVDNAGADGYLTGCAAEGICFKFEDELPANPGETYDYRVRLVNKYGPGGTDYTFPENGPLVTIQTADLKPFPQVSTVFLVPTSTMVSSNILLNFNLPVPMDSYGGWMYYHVRSYVNGSEASDGYFDYYNYNSFNNSLIEANLASSTACDDDYKCYALNNTVTPGNNYSYSVDLCQWDDGTEDCAESPVMSATVAAADFLTIPPFDQAVWETITSPTSSTLVLHFRRNTPLNASINRLNFQVQDNTTWQATSSAITYNSSGSNILNAPGDHPADYPPNSCVGNYRCFKLLMGTQYASPYNITPGNNYSIRISAGANSPYIHWSNGLTSTATTAPNLISVKLDPPTSVGVQDAGSNLLSLKMDYMFNPGLLARLKMIAPSLTTGYAVSSSTRNEAQLRYQANGTAGAWTDLNDGAPYFYYYRPTSTVRITSNMTVTDIWPSSGYHYFNPANTYYFSGRSLNSYLFNPNSDSDWSVAGAGFNAFKPLPVAWTGHATQTNVTNYLFGVTYDYSISGPTVFSVQNNCNYDPTNPDAGWLNLPNNYSNNLYCTSDPNVSGCEMRVYGMPPGAQCYFRAKPLPVTNPLPWSVPVVDFTPMGLPKVMAINFSTSSNYTLSNIGVNFYVGAWQDGVSEYHIQEQVCNPTCTNTGFNYAGTTTAYTLGGNLWMFNHLGVPFLCQASNPTDCYGISRTNIALSSMPTSTSVIMPGQYYRYQIRLCTAYGDCGATTTSETIQAPALLSGTVDNLNVTTRPSGYYFARNYITFRNSNGWDGVYGYRMERSISGMNSFSLVGSGNYANTSNLIAANTFGYIDNRAMPGVAYDYRVALATSSTAIPTLWKVFTNIVSLPVAPLPNIVSRNIATSSNLINSSIDLTVKTSSLFTIRTQIATPAEIGQALSAANFGIVIERATATGPYNYTITLPYTAYTVSSPLNPCAPYNCYQTTLNDTLFSNGENYRFRARLVATSTGLGTAYGPYFDMGEITAPSRDQGVINPPTEIVATSTGSNVIKLKVKYDYQSGLSAIFKKIETALPINSYEVTDSRQYLGGAYPYLSQIQFSTSSMGQPPLDWQDSGVYIDSDKRITSPYRVMGALDDDLIYPDMNGVSVGGYYFIDRSNNQDWYFRANSINRYFCPPGSCSSQDPVISAYTQSSEIKPALKQLPSLVNANFHTPNANPFGSISIVYAFASSGPTLFEVQVGRDDVEGDWHPADVTGYSTPGEYLCLSGNCSVPVEGLFIVDPGNTQAVKHKIARVRVKGTTKWVMAFNQTIVWTEACTNVAFSEAINNTTPPLSIRMVNELRQKINNCRPTISSSLTDYCFENTNSGQCNVDLVQGDRVRAVHINQLRQSIEELYHVLQSTNQDKFRAGNPQWGDVISPGTKIKPSHFQQLQDIMVHLEEYNWGEDKGFQ
ncbi:hypothetical protein HGA64_02445 [Candidatus Falkowbacteria bacterium]|nr:hypothetical protein [Candidatus Falkowbacteria bacterium]